MCEGAKLKRIISRDNSSIITTRYMLCMSMALYKQLKLALLGRRSLGVLYSTILGSSECAARQKPSLTLQTAWSSCGRCIPVLPSPATCSRVGGYILMSGTRVTATHLPAASGSPKGLCVQSLHACQKVCVIAGGCVSVCAQARMDAH